MYVAVVTSLAYLLIGLVIKASTARSADLGFSSCFLHVDFSGSSHTMGTPEATLPGALRYRVSAGTDRPDASIL